MMTARRITAARSRELVIALHCSGAGASQWRRLADVLGKGYELLAPEHYGCESTGPWIGGHPFTLADEAARTIALIDATDRKVHLVGHSYGGGVALHVALARPARIASLSLYEPSAFHLLRQIGGGAAAFAEIRSVAYAIATAIVACNYRRAAKTFVDYWNGQGAWDALRPAVQAGLIAWMPKAPLDFNALFGEAEKLTAYVRVRCPVLVMRGEFAPAPTRAISEALPSFMRAQRSVVAGAGHMGPLTHADEVNALIAAHIANAVAPARRAA
ncbi:MAG: alpha/beta hydrolase [Xanthobacteraceae bacterium]